METLNITLNINQLTEFKQPEPSLSVVFDELFERNSENYRKLAYELQREFKQGGSPDVMQINFDRIKYDHATGKGSLRIVLDIDFTFGCEDVRVEKQDQTSEWTFAVNDAANMITLHSSPFAESRSTADEF